jgi:hypothetical protein
VLAAHDGNIEAALGHLLEEVVAREDPDEQLEQPAVRRQVTRQVANQAAQQAAAPSVHAADGVAAGPGDDGPGLPPGPPPAGTWRPPAATEAATEAATGAEEVASDSGSEHPAKPAAAAAAVASPSAAEVPPAGTGAAKRAREEDQAGSGCAHGAGLQHKWQRKLDAVAAAEPTALAALQQAAQTELDAPRHPPRGCVARCRVTSVMICQE